MQKIWYMFQSQRYKLHGIILDNVNAVLPYGRCGNLAKTLWNSKKHSEPNWVYCSLLTSVTRRRITQWRLAASSLHHDDLMYMKPYMYTQHGHHHCDCVTSSRMNREEKRKLSGRSTARKTKEAWPSVGVAAGTPHAAGAGGCRGASWWTPPLAGTARRGGPRALPFSSTPWPPLSPPTVQPPHGGIAV